MGEGYVRLRKSVGYRAAISSAVVLLLCAMLAGTAYAQSPAGDQYGTKVAGVEVRGETEAQASPAAEAIPNTGFSLLAAAVGGGMLVITGLAIRRREERQS